MQVGADWGGNYSRFTFDEAKNYFYMLKEQGVPVLDDEFNLLQEINITFLRRMIQDIVGNGSPNNCFDIASNNEAQDDFIIKGGDGTLEGAGHYYLDGYLIVLPSDTTFLTQPISQPAITIPTGQRFDRVYLDVYFAEIDALEDANILDPSLNVETSRRLKLQWEVKVSEGAPAPSSYTDANGIYHATRDIGRLNWSTDGALYEALGGWLNIDKTLPIKAPATSSARGLIQIATDSDALAGTSVDLAVAPSNLKAVLDSDFYYSGGVPGYKMLRGEMLQWGDVALLAGETLTITLPIAHQSIIRWAAATPLTFDSAISPVAVETNVGGAAQSTQLTLFNSANITQQVRWITLG